MLTNHRITTQRSHNKKIMWYKTKNKDNIKKQRNSQFTTPRELERYHEVKIFSSNEELVPEPKKPQVMVGGGAVLTKEEVLISIH